MRSIVGSRDIQNAKQQKKLRKAAEQLQLAFAAYCEERHADAQLLCRRLLRDVPDYFYAVQLLGVSVLECGQFKEAKLILERAVGLEPWSAEAHSHLGFALLKLNRHDEARACCEKAIALKPDVPTAHSTLGNALLRLQLDEQAVAAFTVRIVAECEPGCNHLRQRRTEIPKRGRVISLRQLEAEFPGLA